MWVEDNEVLPWDDAQQEESFTAVLNSELGGAPSAQRPRVKARRMTRCWAAAMVELRRGSGAVAATCTRGPGKGAAGLGTVVAADSVRLGATWWARRPQGRSPNFMDAGSVPVRRRRVCRGLFQPSGKSGRWALLRERGDPMEEDQQCAQLLSITVMVANERQ
jgi:hypothetical protein